MTYTERYKDIIAFHKWAERLPEKDWYKISEVGLQIYLKYNKDDFTRDLFVAVYGELSRKHARRNYV